MDAHGEKRPRDEAPVCLTCKKPDGPFPALHPDCHHAYCAKCVLHAEAKWCEFCRKDWNYTYRSFNTDDGHVFVVRCVAGNHLWTDKVIVYYANVNTLLTGDGHVAHLQHKHPEFRAWLVAHGLRRDKTARQRVAKYLERFGPRACLLSWLPVVGDPLCAVAGWLQLPFWPCVGYMAIGKFLRYVAMTAGLLWVFPGVFTW